MTVPLDSSAVALLSQGRIQEAERLTRIFDEPGKLGAIIWTISVRLYRLQIARQTVRDHQAMRRRRQPSDPRA